MAVEQTQERAAVVARRAGELAQDVRGALSGPPSVRVLCVDDHVILVEGLKAQFAIAGQIQIIGHLVSAKNLLDEVARLSPDVVLLDIEMPGPDVFEAADRLHHMYPKLRFAFLSAHVRDGYLAASYRCGAWGYFAKGDDLESIVRGILELARSPGGTFVMGPTMRRRCEEVGPRAWVVRSPHTMRARAPSTGAVRSPLQSLTPREAQVLRLIGCGRSRNQIATELSRSAKTIDGHQDRMMAKLGIESRAELMRFAIREGLAEA